MRRSPKSGYLSKRHAPLAEPIQRYQRQRTAPMPELPSQWRARQRLMSRNDDLLIDFFTKRINTRASKSFFIGAMGILLLISLTSVDLLECSFGKERLR